MRSRKMFASREFVRRSPWHMAAVYGPGMSAVVFGVLVITAGFAVALRTALVTVLITSVGAGLGLIPFTQATATDRRKLWLGRRGRFHGIAAGLLMGLSVSLAVISTTAAAGMAVVFALVVGLAFYVAPRFLRNR